MFSKHTLSSYHKKKTPVITIIISRFLCIQTVDSNAKKSGYNKHPFTMGSYSRIFTRYKRDPCIEFMSIYEIRQELSVIQYN